MQTAYSPTADRNLYLARLLERARRTAHLRENAPDPACPECAGTGRWISAHGLTGTPEKPCPYCYDPRNSRN